MMEDSLWLALVAFGVAFLLRWLPVTRPFLLPLSLFGVLIHELCHGLAALATGGKFERFQMERDGGVALTIGGKRFFIIPAGYVGTAIFGAVLIYLVNTLEQPSHVAIVLGGGFALLTVVFSGMSLSKLGIIEAVILMVIAGVGVFAVTNNAVGAPRTVALIVGALGAVLFVYFISDEYFFTVLIGMVSSLALIGIGIYGYEQDREITRFALNFLAFMVGLNAIFDSWYLFRLIQQPNGSKRGNDATNMAAITPLPAWFWAFVWSTNAVTMLGLALWLVFQE